MTVSPVDLPPSAWVTRWLPGSGNGLSALDLACGAGRHTRLMLARNFRVTAVDRDTSSLQDLAGHADVTIVSADLENGSWPFRPEEFSVIVVTNYLHRQLFPYLIASLAHGGTLIYETFAAGNEAYGKPSNPSFLLRQGELLEEFLPYLRVIAFEDVYVDVPKPARVQRICTTRRER